jgi:signal transduction histidine kinase
MLNVRARRAQRGGKPLSREGDGRGLDRDDPGEETGSPVTDPFLRPRGTRTALVAVVLVAITGGSIFGAIQISRSTAASASTLHTTDQAIRAATIVRAHLALAALGSEDQVEISMEEAAVALQALGESLNDLEDRGDYVEAVEAGRGFAEVAAHALDGALAEIGAEELDASFTEAIGAFDSIRVQLAAQIELTESRYALIGILLGIATAGVAPLVMMFWARSVAKRSIELRELSLRLEQETRIREARSALLRTVVHEFRTPLTGITGLAAILEDAEVRESSEAGEMVEMIRREAEDLAHLTDDILTSARLEAAQLEIRSESVDVVEAVGQVADMFRRRGIVVDVSCEQGLVAADPVRLRQIARNLLSNAVKYGGPRIAVTGMREGDAYRLLVADDGDGLPGGVEARLFQPFPHGGQQGVSPLRVGLGLSIAHQLAQAMGVSLEYRRTEGLTVFELRLPVRDVTMPKRERVDPVEAGA